MTNSITVTFYRNEFKCLASMMETIANINAENVTYCGEDLDNDDLVERIIQNGIAARVLHNIIEATEDN